MLFTVIFITIIIIHFLRFCFWLRPSMFLVLLSISHLFIIKLIEYPCRRRNIQLNFRFYSAGHLIVNFFLHNGLLLNPFILPSPLISPFCKQYRHLINAGLADIIPSVCLLVSESELFFCPFYVAWNCKSHTDTDNRHAYMSKRQMHLFFNQDHLTWLWLPA